MITSGIVLSNSYWGISQSERESLKGTTHVFEHCEKLVISDPPRILWCSPHVSAKTGVAPFVAKLLQLLQLV